MRYQIDLVAMKMYSNIVYMIRRSYDEIAPDEHNEALLPAEAHLRTERSATQRQALRLGKVSSSPHKVSTMLSILQSVQNPLWQLSLSLSIISLPPPPPLPWTNCTVSSLAGRPELATRRFLYDLRNVTLTSGRYLTYVTELIGFLAVMYRKSQ